MTYTVEFQNPELLKAFRAMARAAGEKIKVKKHAAEQKQNFDVSEQNFDVVGADYGPDAAEMNAYYNSPEMMAVLAEAKELEADLAAGRIKPMTIEEFKAECRSW